MQVATVNLKKSTIGALRVDVEASVPSNQWVTYEIQFKDKQGKVIASGIKQAWSESGTWSEEGESGYWSEADTQGGLDVRTNQDESAALILDVLEYSDTAGKEISAPVSFNVTVRSGVVDRRYLWAGLFGTGALSLLTFIASGSGKLVLRKKVDDSDVSDRADTLGGANNLVRARINIKTDEHTPRDLWVDLVVRDGNGETLYDQSHTVNLNISKTDKGTVTGGKGQLDVYFLLEPRSSYGFQVEVHPDASVDRTALTVQEKVRTRWPVQVTPLKST
jgi:hypothetical protein